MIEIVFSDSACGSLKMAQHYGKGKYQDGGRGIIVNYADGSEPTKAEIETAWKEAEKKAQLAWESAIPMDGKTSNIYGFNLMLSFGDISENQSSIKRKQALEYLYSVYPNDEWRQAMEETLERANQDLTTIRERVAAGASLRIWYSNQPDEMCGLYWFMGQLNQWNMHKGQVSIVKLPEWEADEELNIMQKQSWSEVAPEEWHRHISFQKTVNPIFIQTCASHWQELQVENEPLRAVLNGRLVSASEKLYDDFIYREIEVEANEFQEAKIIGQVLGKYQLGIGNSWIALRIEEMINDGKLAVVNAGDEDMPFYNRVLKKCT